MCIPSRIKKYLAEKEALDARIAQLEKLEAATAPVKNLLAELLDDYAKEAPEELPGIWEEILAIGQQHNLTVQPMQVNSNPTADEEKELTGEEYDAAVEEELALDDDIEKYLNPTPEAEEEALVTGFLQIGKTFSTAPMEIPDTISALTLWQPWASLIARGDKKIETRSWATTYRGPLAIHAAKRPVDWSTLNEDEYELPEGKEWPLGAVVAIVDLIDCIEMTPEFIAAQSHQERQLGLWQPGRFAWVLENVRAIDPPVSAKGEQKLWKWDGMAIAVEPEESQDVGVGEVEEEQKTNWEEWDSKFKSSDNQWEVWVKTKKDGSLMLLFQGKDEGFTETVTSEKWQDIVRTHTVWTKKGALGDYAEEVLQRRLNAGNSSAKEQSLDTEETKPAKPETETNFEAMGFTVQVYPQPPMGVTFRFLSADGTVAFSSSLTTPEISDRTWRVCAYDLIQDYRDKETARLEKIANPYTKEEDKFVELVKITNAVGYLKRRDTGELISAYAAFANRNAVGEKTATMAKPRAKKWAEHLHSSFESCGWKVEEPRKVKRMQSELGAKQQFAYEIKISGKFSIGQLQKLAEEDFSLLPNEVVSNSKLALSATTPPAIYHVITNGYQVASGSEQEMRSRFEQELRTFGSEGRIAINLVNVNTGEDVEAYYYDDFAFIRAQDFDEENPEYFVLHKPTKTNFRVYRSLASGANWVNSIYPYNGLSTKEAAAVDAVRRQLKAESAE